MSSAAQHSAAAQHDVRGDREPGLLCKAAEHRVVRAGEDAFVVTIFLFVTLTNSIRQNFDLKI